MLVESTTPSALRQRVPNLLTILRVFLTAALVWALSLYQFPLVNAWALPAALGLFVVAAVTDALDGHLARRWNAITLFGRVVDPAADKLLVLGTLVMMASPVFVPADGAPVALERTVTGVAPWMVIVILARELVVSSLRAVLESEGIDFSATRSGKLKMVLQSVGVPIGLGIVWLASPASLDAGGTARWTLDILFWTVTLATIASSVPYAVRMIAHMTDQRPARDAAKDITG
jgi:phosphatidylglycerophosphate synthase